MGPFVARGREIIGAWEKLPMPVIAALDGVRSSSGVGLTKLISAPGCSWRRFGDGLSM